MGLKQTIEKFNENLDELVMPENKKLLRHDGEVGKYHPGIGPDGQPHMYLTHARPDYSIADETRAVAIVTGITAIVLPILWKEAWCALPAFGTVSVLGWIVSFIKRGEAETVAREAIDRKIKEGSD